MAIPLSSSSNPIKAAEIPHSSGTRQSPSTCCHPVQRETLLIPFPAQQRRRTGFFSFTLAENRFASCSKLIWHFEPPYHFLIPLIKLTGTSCVFVSANTTFLKKPLTLLAFVSCFFLWKMITFVPRQKQLPNNYIYNVHILW